MARSSAGRDAGQGVATHALLVVLTLMCLTPLAVMVSTSFKPLQEIFSVPPSLWPEELTFDNYVKVFTESSMPRAFLNSLLIATLTTLTSMLLGGTAGYALARRRFPGSRGVATFMLLGQLMPVTVLLVPLYQMVSALGLVDTIPGIAFAHLALTMPLVTWMARNYFRTIPVELEEAAQIDGCTRLDAVVGVVLPLAAPGMAAIGMFCFLQSWNEFVLASVLANSDRARTATIGLTEFAGQFEVDWGSTMAAATVMGLPIVALFLFLQRYFVQGLTSGSVKG